MTDSQYRELEIRQPVWARNFREGPHWVQGIVADRIGPLSYLVILPEGDLWRRHIDQLDYLWVKFSHAMVVPVV